MPVGPHSPSINRHHGRRPLEHLTIIDLTTNVPGPFCSTILSDFGARVIKIEPPGGDPLRHSPGMFKALNRGKQKPEAPYEWRKYFLVPAPQRMDARAKVNCQLMHYLAATRVCLRLQHE